MEHAAKLSLVRQPLMAELKTPWSHCVISSSGIRPPDGCLNNSVYKLTPLIKSPWYDEPSVSPLDRTMRLGSFLQGWAPPK